MAVTFVAANTTGLASVGTSVAATISGIQTDDLLIASVRVANSTTATVTAPAGWTQLGIQNISVGNRHAAFYKLAAAGDAGSPSFTFTFSNSSRHTVQLLAFRGATYDAHTMAATAAGSAATTHSAPSVTASQAGTLVVAAYADNASGMVFSGMTERVDYWVSSNGNLAAATEDVSAGATGTRTVTTLEVASVGCFSIALASSASAFYTVA